MRVENYNNLYNEGTEGFIPASVYAEDERAVLAEIEKEWSKENTITRRMAWNAVLVAEKKSGKKVNLEELERRMGFSHQSLKYAIGKHGL